MDKIWQFLPQCHPQLGERFVCRKVCDDAKDSASQRQSANCLYHNQWGQNHSEVAFDFLIMRYVPTFDSYRAHYPYTVKNKREKLEHIGKVIFDIPFMTRGHAESMKKILGAV